MDFGQRCAIVTGGESGIGKACALALGAADAAVALTYFRDRDAAEAVVAQIASAGGKALAQQADVGDEAAVERCSPPPKPPSGQCSCWSTRRGST